MPLSKPCWLKRPLPKGGAFTQVSAELRKRRLNTVCEEARCPNRWECFSQETATFLILGNRCTRRCRFCAIEHGVPLAPDRDEPEHVAMAAKAWGLRHAVITSVTRDDLPDGGAGQFIATSRAVRRVLPRAGIELLIPDLGGDEISLGRILEAGPTVLNHNVETVPRLYERARPKASFDRSLRILRQSRKGDSSLLVKSGVMLGLGETDAELRETFHALRAAGCTLLTIGQYLQPTKKHLPVERYIPPEEFDQWREEALSMGFHAVASGPLVRSSYRAAEMASLAGDETEKASAR